MELGGDAISEGQRKHEAILAFIRAQTESAVHEALASSTSRLLPADLCKVATVDQGALVVRARSDDKPVDPDRRLGLTDNPIGRAVTSGSTTCIDDLQLTRSTAATQPDPSDNHEATPVRALLAVPFSTDGVLIAVGYEPGVFDSQNRETADRLIAYAEAALDRLQHDQSPSHEQVDDVYATIAHDITSPLTVARGYLDLAEESGDFEKLARVRQALNRIDQITTDLTDLAHPDQDLGPHEPVSLATLANECWTNVINEPATLTVEEDIEIQANAGQLRHLLENLFRNAVDHGGPAVTVTVGTLSRGFFVEDTGPGIPKDRRDEIFELGVTTSDTGTGYGLAIVKRIVEAHGWTITVTESATGGARFEITDVR